MANIRTCNKHNMIACMEKTTSWEQFGTNIASALVGLATNQKFKDDELLVDILLNRTRGLSIPGPMQSQPQQPTQATDPKEKGKRILVEEPKKKKLTLQQIRALETTNDEEVARKIQAE
ncbi:hypothetical protein Tco_1494504 [Tanacetum coccineum]